VIVDVSVQEQEKYPEGTHCNFLEKTSLKIKDAKFEVLQKDPNPKRMKPSFDVNIKWEQVSEWSFTYVAKPDF